MVVVVTANVREHDYWGMVRASAAITQQICAVLIFFVRRLYRCRGPLALY